MGHLLHLHGFRPVLRRQWGDPVPRRLMREALQLRRRSSVFAVSPDNPHRVPRVALAELAVLRQASW